jgi:hypothetical protein
MLMLFHPVLKSLNVLFVEGCMEGFIVPRYANTVGRQVIGNIK